MLGAIIGDIVGSTREWHNIKTENFELLPPGSRFTDDTVMTLAVAQWLMTDPDHCPETLVDCMQRMGNQYPRAGYGHRFSEWLASDNPQPYGSYGNGSAMRVSPVGLYAQSLDEALELARITASVTHNHPEGIKGAQAIAACVFLKKNDTFDSAEEIKEYIVGTFGYNLDIDLNVLRRTYRFDVTCQGSVPVAIKAFLDKYKGSAEEALRLAISMGGDSDTIGAMTAGIAGAPQIGDTYSNYFSKELIEGCRKLLTPDLLAILDSFETFIAQRDADDLKKRAARTRDRIRGSLIAGAAGDALGYTVEFMRRGSIQKKYGNNGITQFDLSHDGKALVSDDTQMTLFTAAGMLMGITRVCMRGIGCYPEDYVQYAYIDWYYTQTGFGRQELPYTWLRNLPELAHRRAPGNTCLTACEGFIRRQEAHNNSKGCGGIMRVAPMALLMAGYWSRGEKPYDIPRMDEAGAKIAEVTHKHPLGFLPAAMMTHFLYRLMTTGIEDIKRDIAKIALDSIDSLDKIYKGQYESHKQYLATLTRKAVKLAANNHSDADNIRSLGEGWVGEEAWAIALYCAVRHIDDIEQAIIAAVNHDGDSDSTGAVCGNIMGAVYGYKAIKRMNLLCPQGKPLEETLELADITLALADDLFTSCIISEYEPIETAEQQQWFDRYYERIPAGITRNN